jgi:hypothetical protein
VLHGFEAEGGDMTITDILTVLGSAAGLAVLLVMALAPALLDLPQRPRPERAVAVAAIPAQRTAPAQRPVHAA